MNIGESAPIRDWLHDINPWIDWNAYSLSMDYVGHNVRILGT